MKKPIMIAAGAIFAQVLAVTSAHAAQCADRSLIKDRLETVYGEQLTAVSAPRNGAVLEVYTKNNAQTWTVMLSFSRGLTCLVASGQGHATLQTRLDRTNLRGKI